MALRVRIEEQDHPEITAQEWLWKTDDKILACRGQGHAWPKLRRGVRNQKGIRHLRLAEGQIELTFICKDCGMTRRLITKPSGEIDLPAKYSYDPPKGYKAPKGVTRRMAFAETNRRWLEDITAENQRELATNEG